MIYEMRTYSIRPGKVAAWESSFAEAYNSGRGKFSKLGGLWHTELGPLNQVIHIWPYESLQHRADVRAAAAKELVGKWPPPASAELVVTQETDIMDGVKGMKDWDGEPKSWGEVYELRTYTYAPGDAAKAAAAFGEALSGRDAVYPVAGMFMTSQGNLNKLQQLFPYKSWDHREEVRKEFREKGVWPPHAEVSPVSQLVRLMAPADVSPLK